MGDQRADARPVHSGTGSSRRSRSKARKAIIKVLERVRRRRRARPGMERGAPFRGLTRGRVRGGDRLLGHDGRACQAGRQRATRRPGGAGRRVPHGPRRDAGGRGDPRAARSCSTASEATAAPRRSSSPRSRSSRRWTASSTRRVRICRARAVDPERAPGAARRELNLDRGLAGRDRSPATWRRPRRCSAATTRRLAALDEQYFRSSIAGILANVLALRGAFAEAERYAALAESLADEEDLDTQVAWRTARAKVLANTGRGGGGARACGTGGCPRHRGRGHPAPGDALTELGRVLVAVGPQGISQGPPCGRP